jgi:phospholipid/cholesterol/gamma-HCH transport system substrate-binding protein
MTGSVKEVVVGVVFFATLVLLAVFTVLIGNYNPLDPPKEVYAFFPKVSGLREGNVVRIAGLERGSVKKMYLHPRGVVAMLELHPRTKLFPNYKMTVRSFSPLGGKYIDLERGDLAQPPIQLPEQQPDEPTDPKQALQGLVEAELLAELADFAETVKPMLVSAVANIQGFTAKMNSTQGSLGLLVSDPSLYNNLRNASKNLDETTASVNRVLGKIDTGNGTLALLVNDPRLYNSTVDALDGVARVAGRIDRGEGTVGALFTDNRMRDDVKSAITHIDSILAGIDQGQGTLGQVVRNPRLYNALTQMLEDLSKVSAQIAEARGPLGVFISDEKAGEDVRRIIASAEKVTAAMADGRGTLGRLFMDDRLINEAERVAVELRESVEDFREQAPINSFVQSVFQAF